MKASPATSRRSAGHQSAAVLRAALRIGDHHHIGDKRPQITDIIGQNAIFRILVHAHPHSSNSYAVRMGSAGRNYSQP
ncbi:hypothetical protein [Paenibacillus pinistramenti]|uniref:hypothetical protein n=1 Tax=Paenibacillus pinistramenti TaxID=1768003 RepID=UPI001396BB48|nr:hypothetical protein [Paenibacillus pinistramenti]